MLWRFLAATGCRRGEALGLRWATSTHSADRHVAHQHRRAA